MMIVGIAAALTWKLGLNLSSAIYEVLPGMAAGFIVYGIAQFFPQAPPQHPLKTPSESEE